MENAPMKNAVYWYVTYLGITEIYYVLAEFTVSILKLEDFWQKMEVCHVTHLRLQKVYTHTHTHHR